MVIALRRVSVSHCTKVRSDRSNHWWDVAFLWLFQNVCYRYLGIRKFLQSGRL